MKRPFPALLFLLTVLLGVLLLSACGFLGPAGSSTTAPTTTAATTTAPVPDGLSFSPIGEYAYRVSDYTGSATELTVPSTYLGKPVMSIDYMAFSGCTSLKKVTLPDSVTQIDTSSFYGCTSLTDITVAEGNTTFSSLDGNLYSRDGKMLIQYAIGKKETSFTTPDGVESIGSWAFRGCTSLKTVTVGSSVKSIKTFTVGDGISSMGTPTGIWPSLESITVAEGNTAYMSLDGNLYSRDGKTLIQYATGKEEASFTTPDGVESIGSYAFSGCASLASVTIGNSVEGIDNNAFSGCQDLVSVSIGDGARYIGNYAFYGCSSLASLTLGDRMESIGNWAFISCGSLASVTLPDSVEYIGYSAFQGCWGLRSLTIGSGVRTIVSSAFSGCSSLTSVTIPDSVESIGYHAFEDCYSLTIYCEAVTKPAGWDSGWNPDNRPVEWGYTGE